MSDDGIDSVRKHLIMYIGIKRDHLEGGGASITPAS